MKSAKKGVSVEEWRARWWTGEDARVRAVQGAARRCTAGVGRWSRRRVSALSGAADANPSEQQAALRLLLLKMKSRAGRSFLLACAGFLLCGLMIAESRVREQDVAAEEMRAPGAGAARAQRTAQRAGAFAARVGARAGSEQRCDVPGASPASNWTCVTGSERQPSSPVAAAFQMAGEGALLWFRAAQELAEAGLRPAHGGHGVPDTPMWCSDATSTTCCTDLQSCIAAAASEVDLIPALLSVLTVVRGAVWMFSALGIVWAASFGRSRLGWPGCVGVEYYALNRLGAARYAASRAVVGRAVAGSVFGTAAVVTDLLPRSCRLTAALHRAAHCLQHWRRSCCSHAS